MYSFEDYNNYNLIYNCILENVYNDTDFLIKENVISAITATGKNILKKIAEKTKSLIDFINNIKTQLITHIDDILKNTKHKIKEKLKVDNNFISVVKKHISVDKNAFIKDVNTCKDVSDFYITKFNQSIVGEVMKALHNTFKTSESFVMESLDINVIEHLISHLHKLPPFAWLDMLHHKGTKGAEHIINGLSYITTKLGGPQFTLPVISSILGIAFEYNIKGLIKHGILHGAEIFSIPFVSLIIKTAGNVATFLAVHELCRELLMTDDEINHSHH